MQQDVFMKTSYEKLNFYLMLRGEGMESETVIQRYMNLSKFIYLLQNSTLFLPKMSIFDDQLDGGLTAID